MSAPWKINILLRNVVRAGNKPYFVRHLILPPSTLYPIQEEINRYKTELPGQYKTWKQVQEELSKDELNEPPVNIGAEWSRRIPDKNVIRKQLKLNKQNYELEQAARLNSFEVPLDEVAKDTIQESGPSFAASLIKHYGIYEDLFNWAYFVPVLNLNIYYDYDEESVTPVCLGNKIHPVDAKVLPIVEYESDEDSLWTLLMTNPDGHLTDNDSEYIHWLVGNVKGSDIESGETLCNYLQPFPARGTGFQRHIFVLFKQEKHVDYSAEKRSENCTSLKERTFKTVEFIRKYFDDLTPVGCCFYQSEWDQSVKDIYHNTLNMREPAFEFHHPPPFRAVQQKYPKKEPFDRYFDRYRDKKEINEEVLRLKLEMKSPFKEYEKPKYPLLQYEHKDPNYKPSWLINKEKLMHRRLEQFEELP